MSLITSISWVSKRNCNRRQSFHTRPIRRLANVCRLIRKIVPNPSVPRPCRLRRGRVLFKRHERRRACCSHKHSEELVAHQPQRVSVRFSSFASGINRGVKKPGANALRLIGGPYHCRPVDSVGFKNGWEARAKRFSRKLRLTMFTNVNTLSRTWAGGHGWLQLSNCRMPNGR